MICPADSELSRWTGDARSSNYLIVPDIDMLEGMMRNPVVQAAGEVTRVVIDGGAELDRFLLLIATLPDSFAGDILFIRGDGSGHFSSRELKTKRTVRTISKEEVEIYLRWHNLPARPRSSYVAEDAYGNARRVERPQ
ncbi:MAG TPA: hypothetical protein VF057_08745 [Thermoanaerobaculia bacterium]